MRLYQVAVVFGSTGENVIVEALLIVNEGFEAPYIFRQASVFVQG